MHELENSTADAEGQQNANAERPLMAIADIEKEFQGLCEIAGAKQFQVKSLEAEIGHINSRMAFLVGERDRTAKAEALEEKKKADEAMKKAEEKRQRKEARKKAFSKLNPFSKSESESFVVTEVDHEAKTVTIAPSDVSEPGQPVESPLHPDVKEVPF